jgi:hypothetical protein
LHLEDPSRCAREILSFLQSRAGWNASLR